MTRRRKSLTRMSLDAMQAAQDAAVTISARLPDLAQASSNVTSAPSAEVQRMVSEKLEASVQGGLAASVAFGAFWLQAMTGGVRTPMELTQGLAQVADAAMRPARNKVRANAIRLCRRGS